MPPFDNVMNWFQQRQIHVVPDTQRVNIQPDTPFGSFEALILAVLYSSEIDPQYAERTIRAMMENNLTGIHTWLSMKENDETWNSMMDIFITNYQNGRFRRDKTQYIKYNAAFTLINLNGDIRLAYDICDGNEIRILKYLRNNFKGIKQKAFWFLREMRMHGIWNVSGQYCCVPDKQVGNSLRRWNYIAQYNNKFQTHLQCSQVVWDYFNEMYDFPILLFSREHQCNSKMRHCEECETQDCADRL